MHVTTSALKIIRLAFQETWNQLKNHLGSPPKFIWMREMQMGHQLDRMKASSTQDTCLSQKLYHFHVRPQLEKGPATKIPQNLVKHWRVLKPWKQHLHLGPTVLGGHQQVMSAVHKDHGDLSKNQTNVCVAPVIATWIA